MAEESAQPVQTPVPALAPLYVDLDGTLLATDLLFESALLLAKHHPLKLAMTPIWLLRDGKAAMKDRLAAQVAPDVKNLPYRPAVLDFLRNEKAQGRRIILATASHRQLAQAVADHLEIFDAVLASDSAINLSGPAKLAAIQKEVGSGPFEYMGDSHADIGIFQASAGAYLVNPRPSVLRAAKAVCVPRRVFDSPSKVRAVFKAVRPTQWIKNILLLLPVMLAHQVADSQKVWSAILGIVCFSLLASSVYICNDLLDIEADRKHPRKSRRPFASGTLSIPTGMVLMLGLLLVSFGLTAFLPQRFAAVLLVYFAVSTAYTFYFKRKLLLDVMVLAGLYTIRLLAGGAAADVVVTQWLLAFSMFLFLSLAFAKRYSELRLHQARNESVLRGRGYRVEDLEIILSVGPASGYLAVLVLCLYIQDQSAAVSHLYGQPMYLWLICPLLLYWITRVWFFARRGQLVDDPILFALRDRVSYLVGLFALALAMLAARGR